MKNEAPFSIRQGDVLLLDATYVGGIPTSAEAQPAQGHKVVLALGEATGHHHRFEFRDTSHNVKLYSAGGERYLGVTQTANLLHEEHTVAKVPKRQYVLPRQMQYTPAALTKVVD